MDVKYDAILQAYREVDEGGGASGGVTAAQASSIAKQVALPKNSSWTTIVGDYRISFSEDGLEIANDNGGLTIAASSGYIQAGVWDEYTEETTDLIIQNGAITAGGSAITQATSEFDGTSLGIAELAGGVKYICSSALSALSIGSAAPGCNAAIFFTVANGAVVTPPANVPFFGEPPTSTGVQYVLAVNGDMAVCAKSEV